MSAGMFSKQEKTDHFVLCVALKKRFGRGTYTSDITFFSGKEMKLTYVFQIVGFKKNDQQKKKSSKLSSERTIPEFEALEN